MNARVVVVIFPGNKRERRLITIPYKRNNLFGSVGVINKNEIEISSTFELLQKLEAIPHMVLIKSWTFFVKQ